MKISKRRLRQIILEEYAKIMASPYQRSYEQLLSTLFYILLSCSERRCTSRDARSKTYVKARRRNGVSRCCGLRLDYYAFEGRARGIIAPTQFLIQLARESFEKKNKKSSFEMEI